jgi:hypothetical protein
MSRLGVNGPHEVKKHPWFDEVNWQDLRAKTVAAPFVPPSTDNYDTRYNSKKDLWNDADSEQIKKN